MIMNGWLTEDSDHEGGMKMVTETTRLESFHFWWCVTEVEEVEDRWIWWNWQFWKYAKLQNLLGFTISPWVSWKMLAISQKHCEKVLEYGKNYCTDPNMGWP